MDQICAGQHSRLSEPGTIISIYKGKLKYDSSRRETVVALLVITPSNKGGLVLDVGWLEPNNQRIYSRPSNKTTISFVEETEFQIRNPGAVAWKWQCARKGWK
jgi:hypothetical protein